MEAIKFLAVLCFAAMTVLPMGNGKNVCKAAIHLAGIKSANIHVNPHEVIDQWSTSAAGGSGYATGGMVYDAGQITVPDDGLYYVYCQVYFNEIKPTSQHEIIINSRTAAMGNYATKSSYGGTNYTGLSALLKKGDKIACRAGQYGVTVWTGPATTFFGAYEL